MHDGYKSCNSARSVVGRLSGQSQETQQEGRQQGLLTSNLNGAVSTAASVPRGGFVAGGLEDVGVRSAIC